MIGLYLYLAWCKRREKKRQQKTAGKGGARSGSLTFVLSAAEPKPNLDRGRAKQVLRRTRTREEDKPKKQGGKSKGQAKGRPRKLEAKQQLR